MLAYQHAYHAGNLADVHKHAALAWVLDYLGQKPKPFCYIDTHAGRALYDLGGPEAVKTGEAARGIMRAEALLPPDAPYLRVLRAVRAAHGAGAYPGSPLIARQLMRADDTILLAERHPEEAAALRAALPGAEVHEGDGPAMALARTPPMPRRGVMLVDPSYEMKDDYAAMPRLMAQAARKWNVGVLILWYPILASGAQAGMVRALGGLHGALHHRIAFPPAREGHGMVGSGLCVVNPPWGMADMLSDVSARLGPRLARD